MINIQKNILQEITDNVDPDNPFLDSKLTQILSLPDNGATSAVLALNKELNQYAANTPIFCLYITIRELLPHLDYINQIADTKHTVFATIKNNNYTHIFNIIKKYANNVDYVIIDNFARFILHKKPTVIRNIAATLVALSKRYDLPIYIVNQYRYDVYNKTDKLVPLYNNYLSRYISNFVEYVVTKDENNDINMTINLINQNGSSGLAYDIINNNRNAIRDFLSFYQQLNSYDNPII